MVYLPTNLPQKSTDWLRFLIEPSVSHEVFQGFSITAQEAQELRPDTEPAGLKPDSPRLGCVKGGGMFSRWWFQQIFFIFIPTWGRWTHFDDHIFQMGWNHQPVFFSFPKPNYKSIFWGEGWMEGASVFSFFCWEN